MNLKKKPKSLYVAAITFTCFLWGVDVILVEMVMESINPYFTAFLKTAIAGLFFLTVFLISRSKERIHGKDLIRVAICGLLGMSLYFIFENKGIEYTSGALSSLILATMPIIGMIGDRLVFGAKITKGKVLGIIFSIIGVALIVTGSTSAAGLHGNIIGFAFMFGAVMCWAVMVILIKPLYDKYSLLTVVTYQCAFGGLFLIPVAVCNVPEAGAFTPQVIGLILLIAVGCTTTAEFTHGFAVSGLSVTTLTAFENIIPIVSVIMGYLVFKETLTIQQFIGGGIVIAAVAAITRSAKN